MVMPGRPAAPPSSTPSEVAPSAGEQPGAAVVGAAAAEPDHHPPGAGVERGEPAARRRRSWWPVSAPSPPVRCSPHACALSTYAVAPSGAVDQQHGRRHRLAVRAGDRDREQLAAERGVQHVAEAGPAVGHRREVELVVGRLPAPALGDRLGGLDGGQGARELVGSDEDAHVAILPHADGVRALAQAGVDLSPIVVEQVVPVGPDAAFTGFTRDLGAWWDPRLTPDPATYTGVDLDPEIGGEVAMRHGDERFVWGRVTAWEPGCATRRASRWRSTGRTRRRSRSPSRPEVQARWYG